MTTETLWLESGVGSSRESVKVIDGARNLGYRVGWGQHDARDRIVPVGSVDYCEDWLGYSPVPDFYPDFLREWTRRAIGIREGGGICRMGAPGWFVKSAERYKAFPARVIRFGEEYPPGKLYISEVVRFTQEWRYYVADGCVLATGWYDGEDENEPAPDMNINWPSGFCGAVDFGRLHSGQIALVESHHPYACGWYGDDSAAFVMWLVEGWRFMRSLVAAR